MKKTLLIIVVIMCLFAVCSNFIVVEAANTVDIKYVEQDASVSCEGLLTQDGLDMIKEILNWIRIIAPALTILLVSIDFAGAVVSQDNDSLNKATKKVVPRLIATALLFFVPTIIRGILSIDGISEALTTSDDPLCNIK